MKISSGTLLLLLFACFCSCSYDPNGGFHGELRSDGYIRYIANGQTIFIPDSIVGGDPSIFLLSGDYFRSDSTLNILGTSDAYSVYRGISIHLIGCTDTGMYELSSHNFSSATIPYGGLWSTDSLRKGQLHLTVLDTTGKKSAGTFRFWAKANNGAQPDSILVDSGRFFNIPIEMLR